MNARQHQQRLVDKARHLKEPLEPLALSFRMLQCVASVANMMRRPALYKHFDDLTDGIANVMLWCEAHDTFVSFDETDKYISDLRDHSDGVSVIGLLCQNLCRIFSCHAEELQLDDEVWHSCGQRLFNNFALAAKLDGYEYEDLLERAYLRAPSGNSESHP